MSKILNSSLIVRSTKQVSTNIDGETVILDLRSDTYFGLEGVGARIWEMIQEPVTVQEILERLLEEYEVERQQCERDLLAFLEQLAEAGLIEVRRGKAE